MGRLRGHSATASSHPSIDGRLNVRRSDLVAALEEVTIAYENAVAAADAGLLDFEPFDGLAEALRILRAAVATPPPS